MDDKLTPEQREEVERIRIALEGELRANTSSATSKKAIKDLEDVKEDALAAIQHTVKFSQNESLKIKVAMWAYDKLIADGKATVDPLTEFALGMERAQARADAEDAQGVDSQ